MQWPARSAFKQLFDANNLDDDGNDVKANATTQGIFFTAPVHPNNFWNIVTEFIATYSLLAFILLGPSGGDLGPLKYFAVSFIVIAIGLSVGTPTGYAINPVRDLGPRLMYAFILPIKDKGSAQWAYAWVPVIGPMFAAIAAGLTAVALG